MAKRRIRKMAKVLRKNLLKVNYYTFYGEFHATSQLHLT